MKGLSFQSSKEAVNGHEYTESAANEPRLSFCIASGVEDILKVYAVRSIVFVNDQQCPFDEEFDGNDFAATHILGYLGNEPVATMRLRFFAEFVKFERVAVRKEFRKDQAAVHMIRYAMELCNKKGYTRLYGHLEKRLMRFWTHFGFVERPDQSQRERLVFSDREYVEAICELEANPDRVSLDSSVYVINRPEGEWDRPGCSTIRQIERRSMSEDQQGARVVTLKDAATIHRRGTETRPLLVVVDIQREYIEHGRPLRLESIEHCLYRCSRVLRHAREQDWDIAHVMWRQRGRLFNEGQLFTELISGFHPHGTERVFVKSTASAYSNPEFAAMMDMRGDADAYLIGFQGPSGCLATLVDGFSRGHRLSFVADASLSPRTSEADEVSAHRYLVDIARQYAGVTTTDDVTAVAGAMIESTAGMSQMYADRGLGW